MNPLEIKRRQIEMCSGVVGLIALLVFGELVGDHGVAYLAAASECFLFLWNLTGSKAADVLGRILRGRSARGQFKNAARMRRNMLVLEGLTGLLGSLLLFFFAEPAARYIFRAPYSTSLIMLLAPAVFLRTVSSVLLGYFQGEGTELPTVIAAVMRQVCVLLFGLLFCRLFQGYGNKVSALLRQEDFAAMYGGMGIVLGILVTEAVVLLFLFLVYRGSRENARRAGGVVRAADSFGSQVRVLYGNLFPAALTGLLRILPLVLGMIFYQKAGGASSDLGQYGVFYGKYMALCGIVILPVSAMLLGSCSKISANLRKAEQRHARSYFWGGLHAAVVQTLFWTMALAVLAPQIAGIFGKTDTDATVQMLRYGSAIIFLAVLSNYFSELLRQMGGRYLVLGLLALYNILYVLCITVMLNAGNLGIMALVYGGLLAEAVYGAAAGAMVCLRIRCGLDWLQGLAIPAGAVCVTGLILLFVSKAVTPHLGGLVTVIVGLAGAAVLYWGSLILLRNFREQDMGCLPGGGLIRAVGKWLRIF